MTDFDFTSMDEVRDVESVNVHGLLKSACVPSALRWKIIRATSRDNARTPMQWSARYNAGFTSGTPWLGINGNYRTVNVAAQKNDPQSLRSWYKTLIALRKNSPTLLWGEFELLKASDTLCAYRRIGEGEVLTVILNCCDTPQAAEYTGELVISSYGKTAFDGTLQPWEAVILKGEAIYEEK
jgi:oligo-1,6-glucosidase